MHGLRDGVDAPAVDEGRHRTAHRPSVAPKGDQVDAAGRRVRDKAPDVLDVTGGRRGGGAHARARRRRRLSRAASSPPPTIAGPRALRLTPAPATSNASGRGPGPHHSISGTRRTPACANTRRCTSAISAATSAALAVPSCTMKFACSPETRAPPTVSPLSPRRLDQAAGCVVGRVAEDRTRVPLGGRAASPGAPAAAGASRPRSRRAGARRQPERRAEHQRPPIPAGSCCGSRSRAGAAAAAPPRHTSTSSTSGPIERPSPMPALLWRAPPIEPGIPIANSRPPSSRAAAERARAGSITAAPARTPVGPSAPPPAQVAAAAPEREHEAGPSLVGDQQVGAAADHAHRDAGLRRPREHPLEGRAVRRLRVVAGRPAEAQVGVSRERLCCAEPQIRRRRGARARSPSPSCGTPARWRFPWGDGTPGGAPRGGGGGACTLAAGAADAGAGRPMIDFGHVDAADADAVGAPGERRFRLLARSSGRHATLWMEKEQLTALGRGFSQLLAERLAPPRSAGSGPAPLRRTARDARHRGARRPGSASTSCPSRSTSCCSPTTARRWSAARARACDSSSRATRRSPSSAAFARWSPPAGRAARSARSRSGGATPPHFCPRTNGHSEELSLPEAGEGTGRS